MKILIVQPATNPKVWGGDAVFVTEPLWAEYLVSAVEKEHDVRLLDLRLEGEKKFFETIESWTPDVFASTAYTVDVSSVKRLAGEVKKRNPKALTVVGGYHAMLAPQDLAHPSLDVVVIGEGVFTFQELCAVHARGGDLSTVRGIARVKGGKLERTPERPWPHLDAFPFPNRTQLKHLRPQYFDKWMKPLASVRASYSCPWRCEFCVLWPTTDGKYLTRSIPSLVEEISKIEEENVFFTDDEAMVDSDRMIEMANAFEKAGIRKQWFMMTRSDTIRRRPDVIDRWAEIGLKRILIGLESPRDQDLDAWNKGAGVADNDEAIRILHHNGIELNAMLIVAQDYEPKDFDAMAAWVKKHQLPTPIYCVLTPFPGTVTHQKLKDQIIVEDYDYYDLLHTVLPTKLPLKEFYMHYAKLWGDLPPMERGILKWRESLPEAETVENLRRLMRSMRS